MHVEPEIELKIILFGDSSTKKTSFLLKYVENEKQVKQIATIGIDMKQKSIYFNGIKIKLIIFDTAGQERFRSLALGFLKGADGAILLYDITNISTFDSLKNYYIKNIEEIKPDLKYIIAGNKIDLEDQRSISREKVIKFCELKKVEHIEVSSKLDINVKECFNMLIKSIIEDKTKKELIDRYGKKYKDENGKICFEKKKKKKIFSELDKYICF